MRFLGFFLIAIFLTATSASAQMIDKLTAEQVGTALAANGLQYIETPDNRGFPRLQVNTTGTMNANGLSIIFYGCVDGACEDLTLWAWYETEYRVPNAQIDLWNDFSRDTRNWARAYIDSDGDAALTMNINATGGIGSDAVQILINSYLLEAQAFGEFIGTEVQR